MSERPGFPTESRTIVISKDTDGGYVISIARMLARKAGFNENDEFLIAAAASELATNIYRYASAGEVAIRIIRDSGNSRAGIELLASDSGPGIENVDLAMQDKYTTKKGSLGSGLPSVKRIMDEFTIYSQIGIGVKIAARKWRQHGQS